MNDKLLANKAVVITGAGRGLGRAFALRCAALGASLIVNDIDEASTNAVVQEVTDAGGSAFAIVGSVADWSVAESLTQTCVSRFGAIDGLVNNAAVHHLEKPWDEGERSIRRLVEVNVLGVMYCGTHALKKMIERRRGSIINVTSGAHLGVPSHATYGASKGAVASLTYGWAGECMPYNVRVNALSPAADTPMVREAVNDETRFGASHAFFRGLGSAESVAPLVAYLLSDLSDGITGQNLGMTNGSLGIFSHPGFSPPADTRQNWDEPQIAEAFDVSLRKHLKPYSALSNSYIWDPGALS